MKRKTLLKTWGLIVLGLMSVMSAKAAEGDITSMVWNETDHCYYRMIENGSGESELNENYGYILIYTLDLVNDNLVDVSSATKVAQNNSWLRGFGNKNNTYDTYTGFSLDSKFSLGDSRTGRYAYSPTYGIGMAGGNNGTTYTVNYNNGGKNDIVEFYGFIGGVSTTNFTSLPDVENPVTLNYAKCNDSGVATSTTISSSTTDGTGYSIVKGIKYYAIIADEKGKKLSNTTTITANGYATWSFSENSTNEFISMQDKVAAYVATGYADGKVTLERVYKPNGSAYLLRNLSNEEVTLVSYRLRNATNSDLVETNLLKYAKKGDTVGQTETPEGTTTTYTNFYLTNDNGTWGFYKIPEAGKYFSAHNRAYLSIPNYTNAGARGLSFVFDDGSETTGINSVQSAERSVQSNEYYNLAGQRVAQPTKGLYIVNGKKVIIK